MAVRQDITTEDGFFIGEDKYLVFDLKQDVRGWTVRWTMSYERNSLRPPAVIIEGTGIAVPFEAGSGANNGLRVFCGSDETVGLEPSPGYWHELRRIDDGSNSVLSYGTVHLQAGGQHEV